VERRLAAIVAADVVGYSKLMERDEAGTLSAVSGLINDVIKPLVSEHRGRIVKLMGDGILTEFASVVDAVTCSIAWQEKIAAGDSDLRFRIGINLGDIIIQDGDIFGNGVNVAARLEGLAEPGGICLSEIVHREVRNILDLSCDDLGEQTVKNIAEPVRVFRVLSGESRKDMPSKDFETSIGLDFSIPDCPSIAVLPFTVMSTDPEQEHFADGVTEDIITALSKVSRLLVVARNSTFVYKGRAVDVKQVSREQGVRYVLEGSVRSAGGRVRVTAQLIDATTGLHIWAERYDRELQDIFAVQDEITREIVVAMDVQLREGEQHRVWSSGTKNLEAWECVRLATDAALGGSADAQPRARELLDRALELDPGYAIAWAMRAWLHFTEADVGGGLSNKEQFENAQASAFRCARQALKIDPDCAEAYGILALTHLNAGEHDKAMEMTEKAIALAPNNAEILGGVASAVMRKSGQPERGAEMVKKAMRLSPFYRPGLLRALGNNYRLSGRLEEAVACYKESLKRESGYLAAYVNLVSALGELERPDDAKDAIRKIYELEPNFSVEAYVKGLSYRNKSDLERIKNGLIKAGLRDDTNEQSSIYGRDKLSIAVLPFTNMTGDPEQEYFSDGITEDIITELSRFSVLFVVARHSSFAFKGEKVDIKDMGQKLGVQYVVEGSVRRAGNRVRITAQLIEAETGTHIWADRYDRELEDIFAVQDEVTRNIVGVLPGRVQDSVAERASRKRTENMKAYELLLHGKSVRDSFSAEDTLRARQLFEKAIKLDPHYAKAHAYLADTYFMDLCMGVATTDAAQMSLRHARQAIALDSSDVANHDQLGFAYIGAGMWEDAEVQFDSAVSKVATEAEPMTWIGYGQLMLGRSLQARDMVLSAKRLDPLHPPSFDWVLGQACYFAKLYDDAVRALTDRALLNSFAYACLAGAYGHLDREIEARTTLDSFVKERHREFHSRNIVIEEDTVSALAGGYRAVWRKQTDWDHLTDGLRKAGLSD